MIHFLFLILLSSFSNGYTESVALNTLVADKSEACDTHIIRDKRNQRNDLVAFAQTFVGTPYKSKQYSANGFDCSGFVQYVYQHFDIDLNRTSTEIAKQGRRKSKPNKGDLVFFSSGKRIQHVAIVTHIDKRGIHIIHSTSSKGIIQECIQESKYWNSRYAFAKDVILSRK